MRRLEDRLRESGCLGDEALGLALRRAAERRVPLAVVLIEERLVEEAALLPILAAHHGLAQVSLDQVTVEDRAIKAVPAKLAAHYEILPVRLDGSTLTVAVWNPGDSRAADDLQAHLGLAVERVLAGRRDILDALRRFYGVGAGTVARLLSEGGGAEIERRGEDSQDLEQQAGDVSVIRLVNQLLQEAIRDLATDIHFEARRDGVAVRRRIDGILFETPVPKDLRLLYPAIVSRIKLMSGLDIVERRLPQDGRARVHLESAEYDLRVSVVPAQHGEDVVVRILPAVMLFDLGQLGFSAANRAAIEGYLARPHGLLFVTGPTGSGKSTTLYACLSRLNRPDRKVITIEDPIEYELRGLTQTQVNPPIGLTFGRALRSMLRHDPDVMMVGEVRDRETAEIAIQAAMTGHLVLSTLHTNDAAGAAVRLQDMGIDPYLVVSTVQVFMAQRLVRTLCVECREPVADATGTRFRARGCKACRQTGYRGRVAICELVDLAEPVRACILRKASSAEIRHEADRLGMETLAVDGLHKVEAGVTTEEEVRRVCLT